MNTRGSPIDQEMIEKNSLEKVLKWAVNEGRIHLLNQLVEPGMGFLWHPQQNLIVTKIPPTTARNFYFL